jgi:ectoine hydroxylase-related dioxygenase (phytanoyl-CoA dioxygenase family)
MVYPGSHKLTEEFFDTQTDKSTWTTRDFYPFKDTLSWFTDRGLKPLKVCASPGDLILWDSRTIHYGAEPTEKSGTVRTIIYVAYTPARLATPEALKIKAEIFNAYGGTTHWPHENINARVVRALREDGTQCPRDRTEPHELPERSDRLLKFAGVMPY